MTLTRGTPSTSGALAGALDRLDWQESILDKDLAAPPGAPSVGDRYIIAAVASGAWTGKEDDIAEWSGSAWLFTAPDIGFAVWVEDENEIYYFFGGSWQVKPLTSHPIDPGSGPHSGSLLEANVTFAGAGHGHAGGADGKTVAHSDTSGKTTDDHHAKQHALGAAAHHTPATLAEFNALISNANLKNDIELSWESLLTASNNYAVIARFKFRGTTVLGTPSNIEAIINVNGANPGDIKIFDFTNSLDIAEKTGIANIVPQIVDLGALSNLPAGPAIFELQLRVPAVGAVQIQAHSLSVVF